MFTLQKINKISVYIPLLSCPLELYTLLLRKNLFFLLQITAFTNKGLFTGERSIWSFQGRLKECE